MNPRQAMQVMIKLWLDVMVEEKGMNIPDKKRYALAVELSDTQDFLEHMENAVESYLEDFGDNHELYDLFD